MIASFTKVSGEPGGARRPNVQRCIERMFDPRGRLGEVWWGI